MNRKSLLVGSVASGLFAQTPLRGEAASQVRVITSPGDPGAEPYYAQELGFFRDAGLDVDILSAGSGAIVVNSVVAQSADIGVANLASIVIAYKHGIPLTIVAPATFYDTKTATPLLLVSKTSPIRTAADLNGKIIATAGLGTIVEWAPRLWMDKNGGDSGTVHFVEINMPIMVDAIVSGRVDAGVVVEPYLTQGLPQTRVLAQVYDAIAPHFTISGYFANLDWARANADIIARFQRAIEKAARWADSHHEESAKIVMEHTPISPDVAQKMIRVGWEDRINSASMQPLIDLVARYGGISATFPASQLIFKA